MKSPKVTVLMSVYNGEKYLREAIGSILNQTFKDFEFLIINDGSTDRTREILQSYKDTRIEIINNGKNIGLTKSLNKGLKIAKGEYIVRMDTDDISLPERLEVQTKFLDENRDIGLVGSFALQINENGRVLGILKLLTESSVIKRELLNGNQFCHGSVMFRRECMEEVGHYREEFKSSQDYDLWARIADKYDVANIPEVLYKWRFTPDSISAQSITEQYRYSDLIRELARERREFGKDRFQTLSKKEINKILSEIPPKDALKRRKTLANNYYYWGWFLYIRNDYGGAMKMLLKSFAKNSFNKDTLVLMLQAWICLTFPKTVVDKLKFVKHWLNVFFKK